MSGKKYSSINSFIILAFILGVTREYYCGPKPLCIFQIITQKQQMYWSCRRRLRFTVPDIYCDTRYLIFI